MQELTLSVTEFKAKCLRLLEGVARHGSAVTITKHGRPIARVIPAVPPKYSLRDTWKDVVVKGDIVHFDSSGDWEANQ